MLALAIIAAGCAWFAYLIHSAPLGWEDEDGFHFGEPGA